MATPSPRYKLIAIDLDGTLLAPDGAVSDRTRRAVRQALDAGLLVCFATGRNWTESQFTIEAVGHYATAVFVGGAIVMDTHQRVTLHRTLMDPDLARRISGDLEARGYVVLALQDTALAGFDYLVSGSAEMHPETAQWMVKTQAAVRRIATLSKHSHEHTIRIGMIDKSAETHRVRDEMIAAHGQRIFCQCVEIMPQGLAVLEVFDPSVNKWEGIKQVAKIHGIAHERIIAIGDDVNDLHMIRGAGLGVAMGNAHPLVRAAAGRIIGTNAQDGLAAFLEEVIATNLVEPLQGAQSDAA